MAVAARLVLLLASVTVFWAAMAEGDPCCSPDQYLINLGQVQGVAIPKGPALPQLISIHIACDYKNNRAGEEAIINTAGQVSRMKVIMDYKNHITYTIIGQTCTKTEETGSFTQCLPKDAHYVDTTVLGNGELTGDVYSFYEDVEKSFRGNATMTVSKKGCIPISIALIGEALSTDPPTPLVSGGGYSNFTMGIPDPGRWFDVPAICQKQNPLYRRFASNLDAISDNDKQMLKLVSHMALSPFVRH